MALESIDLLPGFVFWREGCHAFAKHVCKALVLAGYEDAPREEILKFLSTLPRRVSDLADPQWQAQFCSQCLKTAYEKSRKDGDSVLCYFATYFLERDRVTQTMLIDSFVGLVAGLDEALNELKKGEPDAQPERDS